MTTLRDKIEEHLRANGWYEEHGWVWRHPEAINDDGRIVAAGGPVPFSLTGAAYWQIGRESAT